MVVLLLQRRVRNPADVLAVYRWEPDPPMSEGERAAMVAAARAPDTPTPATADAPAPAAAAPAASAAPGCGDLAGVDLAGVDLAGVDLAGVVRGDGALAALLEARDAGGAFVIGGVEVRAAGGAPITHHEAAQPWQPSNPTHPACTNPPPLPPTPPPTPQTLNPHPAACLPACLPARTTHGTWTTMRTRV